MMCDKITVTNQDNKRILLVYHINFLDKDCGVNMHTYEIIKNLKLQGYTIDFFTTDFLGDFSQFHEKNKLEKIVDNFYCVQYHANPKIKTRAYKNFSWVNDYVLQEFQKVISQNNYDYIYIHYIQWIDLVKFAEISLSAKIIYTMHDMNFIQAYYLNQDYLEAFEGELELLEYTDEITCISYDEMYFFKKFLPHLKYTYLPHFLPQIALPEREKDIDVLLLAASNPYNLEGAKWLIEEVSPFIGKDIKVTICGKVWNLIDQEQELLAKSKANNIQRIDFSEDLDELYSRTKISVVPIFKGTGLKIKTVDSLARGIPVVSTLLGVDGFPDKTLNGCLVSDDPQEFAAHVTNLITNDANYSEAKRKIKTYFNDVFSDTVNISKLTKIFSKDNFHSKRLIFKNEVPNGITENILVVTENDSSSDITINKKQNTSVREVRFFGLPLIKIVKSHNERCVYLFNIFQLYKKEII